MKKNVMVAVGLIGLGIFMGVLLVSNFSPQSIGDLFGEEIGAKQAPVTMTSQATELNNAFASVSEAVTPTVVSVSVEVETTVSSPFRDDLKDFFRFFGYPEDEGGGQGERKRRSEAAGSGVIISSDGYIVTNNHVVENAAEDGISITTIDRKVYRNAKLVGRDPLTDLAVLKIDAEGLPAAHFADAKKIRVGEFVIAVGNPFGLNSTVTSGIISAIGRGQLFLPNREPYSVENFIQTDAAINPGNSGGGLFNLQGSLVGINTAIASRTGTYIGYGFAIPVDLAKAVVEDIIEDGDVDRGYIGVSIRTVDEAIAKAVGLKKVEGVVVHNILEDSPAEESGIQPGDIILEVDGESVSTSNELQSKIVFHRSGDKVKLTIWRDGKKIYKSVTLKPREKDEFVEKLDEKGEDTERDDKEPVKFDDLGFTVQFLNGEMKNKYDVESGVFVSQVERYSIAAKQGLFPNGVIVKADKKKVNSPGELEEIFKSKDPGDAVLMQVKYPDTYQIVAIEIPQE